MAYTKVLDAEDIRSALLTDDTKFAGSYIDASISSRSTLTLSDLHEDGCIDWNGSDILYRDDATVSTSSTTMTKKKECLILMSGTYTTSFDGESPGEYQIYKNGSPYGTLRSPGSGWQTFTEVLSFDVGDTYELWMRKTGAGNADARNFRLLGTRVFPAVGEKV